MIIKNDILIENGETKFLYSGEHHQFDYLTQKKIVQKQSIDTFHTNITSRKKFCDIRNIPYVHTVFPCKPVILSHEIKSFNITPIYDESYYHKDAIYPDKVLKNNDKCFLKTDTHTTPYGSWLILKNILLKLDLDFEYTPEFKESHILGDLNRMLGISTEEEYLEFVSFNGHKTKVYDVNNYPGVKGNTGRIRILKNVNPIIDKRVLIFGDSFFNYNLNFIMANIFKEVIFFRSPHFLYEIVDFIKPDIILTGQAERYLPAGIADSNYAFPFLSYVTNEYRKQNVLGDFNSALDAIMSNKTDKTNDRYGKWNSNISANLFRDLAISLEPSELKEALFFMKNASVHRPDGQFILNKIKNYEILLNERPESK